MMSWYKGVIRRLVEAQLFVDVGLVGAKVRAMIDEMTFLDVHYDPTSGSYSYALIDLKLPYLGDKRVFGWDDYPHEGVEALQRLASYPHHFQCRDVDGNWIFEESEMRGQVEAEMERVVKQIQAYLKGAQQ